MALKIKIKKNTLVRKIDGVKKTGYYGKVRNQLTNIPLHSCVPSVASGRAER